MSRARLAPAMMLLVGMHAQAGRVTIEDVVNQAMPMLPPYCKVKIDNGPPAQLDYWVRRLGPGFGHIHHYCFGLAQAIVAGRSTDMRRKNELLGYAITDFSYVIRHSKPSELAVMADVYAARGQAYGATKRMNEALADFKMADQIRQGVVR